MTESISITILIGNSDNKLTQNEWAHFVEAMNQEVRERVTQVHFFGGSDPFAPWQNACWVAEVAPDWIDNLKSAATMLRKSYQQESVAFICGTTIFI